jgi:hypothetical protein
MHLKESLHPIWNHHVFNAKDVNVMIRWGSQKTCNRKSKYE